MKLFPLALVLSALFAPAASAVQFTLASSTATTWTYTLTYDPLDNYAIPGASIQQPLLSADFPA